MLADLVAFFRDPVKGFFRALDYTLPWEVDGVEDAMPVDINALEEWTVGDRMLARHVARHGGRGSAARRVAARHAAAGPAGVAQGHRDPRPGRRCWPTPPWRTARPTPTAVDVDIDLGGRRLTGTVSPVFGDRLVSVTYSKLGGRHLLQSWIPLLALLAHDPGRDWSAVCIGRPKRGTTPQREHLRRPAEPAVDLLADLVAMYDEGRREPLPLPVKTSYAWAEAVHSHGDPERRRDTDGDPTAIPAKTRTRRTCAPGARARG